MRDGVVLRADVLRPEARGPSRARLPHPYGKKAAQDDYTTFARAVERGYAVVVQDVGGRFASAGEFDPYRNEGRDGFDTIEWAASQPWSNGSVGTFGLSYPGAVQWLAAIESPPHLKAMVPAMTFATPRNFFHSGGLFDLSWIEWIWNDIAPDTRARKGLPGPRNEGEAEAIWKRDGDRMRRRLPLSDLPDLRDVAPYYYEWLTHPADDPWWDWCELRGKYDRVKAAVLNLSGWHDDAYGPDGAFTNFTGLREARGATSTRGRALLVGPWVHGVGSTPRHAGRRPHLRRRGGHRLRRDRPQVHGPVSARPRQRPGPREARPGLRHGGERLEGGRRVAAPRDRGPIPLPVGGGGGPAAGRSSPIRAAVRSGAPHSSRTRPIR